MIKRALSALLWFVAASYTWNVIAWVTDLPVLAGPVVAVAVAAFIAVDPMHRIWPRTENRVGRAPVGTIAEVA